MHQQLKSKITDRQALIGIIGLGYVGLPLAGAFHRAGFRILGFDIDQSKIEMLGARENYIKHMGQEVTREFTSSGRFAATTDFSRLSQPDVIIVCVPTPLGKHREPDLSFVVRSGEDIGRCLRAGQLIVLESTTYPGTTREDFLPAMIGARPKGAPPLESGKDFFVAFSPEREDPGRKSHNTKTTPKLVGGLDGPSGELGTLVYQTAIDRVIKVSSAEVAEAAKILENTFRAVNIAMVNELKVLFTDMGIDVWEVIEAAATKPFGFMPFYPGPGLGGHCIPIDPFYLTWKAREVGAPHPLHRARRRDQPRDARFRGHARLRRPQRSRQGRARRTRAGARARVQARHRRRARRARASRSSGSCTTSAPRWTTTIPSCRRRTRCAATTWG